jgi:CrcB protein
MKYITVGAAGIVGALLRYALGLVMHESWTYAFPLATWLINITGSFLLAFLTMYVFQRKDIHPYISSAIGTGLIGSFTTFSTFSVETVQLLQQNAYAIAFSYVMASALGGLAMAWIGFQSGTALFKHRQQEEQL